MPPKKKKRAVNPEKLGIALDYVTKSYSGVDAISVDAISSDNGHVLYLYHVNAKYVRICKRPTHKSVFVSFLIDEYPIYFYLKCHIYSSVQAGWHRRVARQDGVLVL